MPPLKWTPESLRDVERVHDFLAAQSPEAALRAVKAIRQGVEQLGRFPQMGRPVEELPIEFREWVIDFGSGAYIVLYRFSGKEVILLAIRHGREAGY